MKFYTRFAACYGTIWLEMMLIALILSSHIDTGLFGLIGFPIISLLFAAVQNYRDNYMGQDEKIDGQIAFLEEKLNNLRHEKWNKKA